jgi:hypothetical protein
MTRHATVWILIALYVLPLLWTNLYASQSIRDALASSPVWSWTIWTAILLAVVQTQWKIHDAKKFDGLTVWQRRRLIHTAEQSIKRLYLFELLVVIGVVSNIVARLVPQPNTQLAFAGLSAIWAAITIVIWIVYSLIISADLRSTEDLARHLANRRKQLSETLKRLRERSSDNELQPK